MAQPERTGTDEDGQRSILRSSLIWQRPSAAAHAALVWEKDVAMLTAVPETEEGSAIDDAASSDAGLSIDAAPPSDADPSADAGPSFDTAVSATGAPDATENIDDEIARRRSAALAELDEELRARRDELARAIERQRADAERRITEYERLVEAAIARRREETERLWATQQPRALADRIDAAVVAELGDLRARHALAEARLRDELDARRREESGRLEAWRVEERARIEAELANDEQAFHERLLRQLQQFEVQLAERAREQEERLAARWDEVEREARERLGSLLDRALSPDPGR